MTDQYPQPRSLKDDPPPEGASILVSRGQSWTASWMNKNTQEAYTHWLPMPPDPPQPKQAWEEALQNTVYGPSTDTSQARTFKVGWNSALNAVSKLRNEGIVMPLVEEVIERLKAS